MNRGPRLFLAMAIVCAGLAVVVDGLSRVACISAAVTCAIAYLKPSKPKPGDTPPADGHKMRGGCSSCDMRGPKRDTFNEANADAVDHAKRMHGGEFQGGYIESTD